MEQQEVCGRFPLPESGTDRNYTVSASAIFGPASAKYHRKKVVNMDGFSLAVLERTLELVIDAMPPEYDADVAEGVNVIRRYIDSPTPQDSNQLHQAVMQLAKCAHDNREFLIAARLEAFLRDIAEDRRSHDVA